MYLEEANRYFYWLCHFVGVNRSYRRLFEQLHDTVFTYLIAMDSKRAEDGIALRNRYERETGIPSKMFINDYGNRPCSVLEMMVALCLRCEETIMDDMGAGYLFFEMIDNLGLRGMTDSNYDYDYVSFILDRFLYRQYDPDGKGGLFILRNHPEVDARSMEIWMQMNWYLSDYD